MAETVSAPSKILVLGGARSGKSAFALAQAETSTRARIFVATAEPFDEEMRERISRHAAERGSTWRTIEAPYDLCGALEREAGPERILLVDCLTVWLGNLVFRAIDLDEACATLIATVRALGGPAIFVSNEVGMGVVPEHASARRFRDAQGRLNQRMAAVCDTVVTVCAGLPQLLKPAPALDLRLS